MKTCSSLSVLTMITTATMVRQLSSIVRFEIKVSVDPDRSRLLSGWSFDPPASFVATGSEESQRLVDLQKNLTGCLSHECVNQLASSLAMAYPKKDFTWCRNKDKLHEVFQGILLIKMPKVASSTTADVAKRLGDQLNCSAVRWQHTQPQQYANHSPESLLFTSVRDPGARAVSRVYFSHISRSRRLQKNPEPFLLNYLMRNTNNQGGTVSPGQGGFQLQYAAMKNIPSYSAWKPSARDTVQDPEKVIQNVVETLQSFTMVLVAERMDESLVVLALLLGIDVSLVLVQASKVSGANYYYDKPLPREKLAKGVCRSILKAQRFAKVEALLESDSWRAMNYGDYLLHAIAKQSLQRTIESIQPEFDKALLRYRTLQDLVQAQCANDTHYPCSDKGVPQPELAKESCYVEDAGCGYKCVDRVVQEYDRTHHASIQ